MYDILTARQLGASSTGNGRRESFRNYPLVRMTNTFVLNGSSQPEEIFAATKNGLYAKEFVGGVVDTTSGSFTFTVREAYLIENGEITRPVKGATLIGSGPEEPAVRGSGFRSPAVSRPCVSARSRWEEPEPENGKISGCQQGLHFSVEVNFEE
jgi:hypothetical protein